VDRKFDGKDIKDARPSAVVADETAVGKPPARCSSSQGQGINNQGVPLGRLETAKLRRRRTRRQKRRAHKSVVKNTLGLELANMVRRILRRRYSSDTSRAVVTGVDELGRSPDNGMTPGDVIVEIAQEAVASTASADQDRRSERGDAAIRALLLVAGSYGELRFVALSLRVKRTVSRASAGVTAGALLLARDHRA